MAHDFSTNSGLVPFPNCSMQVSQSPSDLRPSRMPPVMIAHPNPPMPMLYQNPWNNTLSMGSPGNHLMNAGDSPLPMHSLPGGDFLNPTQAILANRIHALLSMADPNLDNRGAEIIENWRQFQQAAIANNLDPNMLALCHSASFDPSGSQRRKNATRETTSTLKAWLKEHRKNPYPTKGEKIMLAILTKMTLTQVSTWFANARRRLKKENKMTWAPRNRTDEDNSDDEVGDEPGIDIEDISDTELDIPRSPNESNEKSAKLNENGKIKESSKEESANDDDEPPKKKPNKIWSIVETLAKEDKVRSPHNPSFNPNFSHGKPPPMLDMNSSPPSENSSASTVFKTPPFFFPNHNSKHGCLPNLSFLQNFPLPNSAVNPGYFFGGSPPSGYPFPPGLNPFSINAMSPGFPQHHASLSVYDLQNYESQKLHKSHLSTDPESQST